MKKDLLYLLTRLQEIIVKKNLLEILKSIANYADICEIGFPHNTPIADGGQIQSSAYRALKNGIKIKDVFSIVKDFKKSKKLNL